VLLSAGVNYETFARQVEIACTAGASGFVVGRAIWSDLVAQPEASFEAYVEKVTIPRLNHLTDIAYRIGRSWRTFSDFQADTMTEDWYRDYRPFSDNNPV
jgi:tagatose 1,6-diphosphate aldolase